MILLRLAVSVLAALPAFAIITVNDPSGAIINSPSLFDGVAFLQSNGDGNCSGALLGTGRHVLTAAHCTDNSTVFTAYFDLPGGRLFYNGIQRAIHPDFVIDSNGNILNGDLAIITLDAVVDPLAPRYQIYRGNSEIGELFTAVGYGREGTGLTGDSGGTSGVRRGGTNRFDLDPNIFSNTLPAGVFLGFDFDNGSPGQNSTGDQGEGANETNVGRGDSGGPSFLTIGGTLYLAGIHSWRARLVDQNGNSPDINGVIDGTFGEIAADTRVSQFQTWIDQQVNDIPEPGTWVLLSNGLLVFGWRRWRG